MPWNLQGCGGGSALSSSDRTGLYRSSLGLSVCKLRRRVSGSLSGIVTFHGHPDIPQAGVGGES